MRSMNVAARWTLTSLPTNVRPPMSDAHMKAMMASSIDTRMCCPLPLRSRASNALDTACAAVIPVSLSGRIVRMRRGRAVSEPPCTLARPDSAWMIGS